MQERPRVLPTPQLVLGIVALVVGVIFTLHNMDILDARPFLRYWPLAIIALGIARLVDATAAPGRFAGLLLVSIGGVLLLHSFGLIRFRLRDYWPLILVFIGLAVIYQAVTSRRAPAGDGSTTVAALALFGGVHRVCRSRDFRGGEITAIMGGCDIDLRPSVMQVDEAVISTFAFWGGIEMKVPPEWTVVSRAYPVLGGFDDGTQAPAGGAEKRLVVQGLAIMGGIEIKN